MEDMEVENIGKQTHERLRCKLQGGSRDGGTVSCRVLGTHWEYVTQVPAMICNTTSTMTPPLFLKLDSASERLFWSVEFDATPSKIQIYDEYGNINL